MTVEVERKFVCDAEIMWKLQDIGAKCIGQRQFRDQYFDSPDFILTLKDFWLRCREGLWELKCPAVSGTTPDNDTETVCTRYREITSLPLIQSEVSRIIREHTAEGSESNSSQREQIDKVAENEDTEICSADDTKWLNDLNLVCFAEFKTERCSYTLEREAGAVRVDLDQADFGYCVGEIEVLVPEGGDMNAALQRITGTAVELAHV
ncbi:thiamine-triphosphatase-like isoform X3 [Sinocyclocheilus anshuiensis]|uniref:thiamine-triphosphatase-like isoform X3 n=1 Tax=Sinocyclocheilus anshuiensis TaxID=1608454 RepID=UPI0007B847F9|nr:PREDICTED: thiamine-triphosphatase-like isoform X3 [Sinocyclocheilus anshuiensis]